MYGEKVTICDHHVQCPAGHTPRLLAVAGHALPEAEHCYWKCTTTRSGVLQIQGNATGRCVAVSADLSSGHAPGRYRLAPSQLQGATSTQNLSIRLLKRVAALFNRLTDRRWVEALQDWTRELWLTLQISAWVCWQTRLRTPSPVQGQPSSSAGPSRQQQDSMQAHNRLSGRHSADSCHLQGPAAGYRLVGAAMTA